MTKIVPTPPSFYALVVDDEELYAQAIRRELERAGVGCDLALNAREALHRVEQRRYQAILLDHHLPDDDGLRLIPLLLARQHGAALIMMTAYQTIPNAVEAIRLGADDYVVKETSLTPLVERVLEIRRRDELRKMADGKAPAPRETLLLGRSPAMLEVVAQLSKIAKSPETTVLITGETGVGKEVAARYLHALSRPAESPLVAVDCLAMPENLAESLLFGHEKGAFTGADQMRPGAFEEAKDGTVFLDEIGDMTLVMQGKLLRVLEGRTFRRVGSTKEIPRRARVVSATNRDLKDLVKQGCFRQDLFQRLSVFPIHIPTLRERGEDILLLAEHFRVYFADKLSLSPPEAAVMCMLMLRGPQTPGEIRNTAGCLENRRSATGTGRSASAEHRGDIPCQTCRTARGCSCRCSAREGRRGKPR